MGLSTFWKKSEKENTESKRAKELRLYINDIEGDLKNDWNYRVYGDGTYSGYNVLREFYEGRQWSFKKEEGSMRTYNYCFTVVENLTAFLTNEPPQMSSPARRMDDPLERSLAEGRTKLLNEIHEENSLPLVFQRAARTASITGDAFIFGAIPTFKVNDNGNKEFDGLRYYNVEKPETIRPIYKDEDYNEIGAFIKHYRMSVSKAKRIFADEIKDKKIVIREDYDIDNIHEPTKDTQIPMMTIKEYWDDKEYVLMFGQDNRVVHYVKHDWGFIPLHHVPNIHLPGHMKGTSDIEHELDPQQEYNERTSDMSDIIKEIARPSYWGKNLDNLTNVGSGKTTIYNFGDDAELNAMPKSGSTMELDKYVSDRKNDIIALSGQNQVLYPGSSVMQATGRALSVVMQGVNNKISLRKEWWVKAFKDLNRTILYHLEKQVPNSKILIGGFYKTDVFISSVLLRSVSDEINKFQAKVQSQTTTMHNVGVPNPSEEQKLMKEELQDSILATEIARQPALLHQVIQEQMAMQQQQAGGGVEGQPPPIANESENEPGENPAAMQGVASPVSAKGAVNMMAARGGARPQIPEGR